MPISTNGAIITRVAGALYGEYLSNASYVEVSTTAPATTAPTKGPRPASSTPQISSSLESNKASAACGPVASDRLFKDAHLARPAS